MARRVTAIFDSRTDAERAADALVDMGADRAQISIVARGDESAVTAAPAEETRHRPEIVAPAREVGDSGAPLTTTDEHEVAHDAGVGAAVGAAAGIAAGLASLVLPGFPLVLAAGPLAWAIGGAVGTTVAGAVVGGVYGALHDIGIEEAHARHYEERIRGGGALMTALVPTMDEQPVRDVLDQYGAEDISFSEDTAAVSGTFPAGEAALANPAYAPHGEVTTPPVSDTTEEYAEEEEIIETRRL